MDNFDLSAFFSTKSEANDYMTRIAQLSERVYNTDFDLEKELAEKLGLNKKEKFMILLRDNNISTSSNSALKAFFEKIIAVTTSLPVLSVTIAFEPRDTTLKKLSDWFILNFKSQALFELKVDKNIIGGAVIDFKGKHGDFTIKTRFDQITQRLISRERAPGKSDEINAQGPAHAVN